MKKIKKILAVLTTTAVSAISLCSLFTASADSTQLKTFRIFHNANASSNITYFDYTIIYNSSVTAIPSVKTSLLDSGYFTSSNNGKVQATYLGSAISQSGTVATTDFYTPMNVTSIFGEITYNATIRNSNNVTIDPNSITMNAVLMGDVNQDGVVNIDDINVLNTYLLDPVGSPMSANGLLAADVSYDGQITSDDSLKIMNYIGGVISKL